MTPKQKAIHIIRSSFGDDLYRARNAFKNKTPSEMNLEYGQSGRTCAEILQGYEQDQQEKQSALDWATGAPE
jgi:hypothetical protein